MRLLWRLRTEILLVLVAGLFALGVAEGLTRWLAPYVRDHAVPGGLFATDELLGWKLRAGAQSVHRTSYSAVEYAINAAGHRDRTRAAARTPDVRRILAYGDSNVFGWGVPVGERYTDLLEAELPAVEIWNLAVPGYGLDQQILAYERDGDVAADEVMLWVSGATFERSRYATMYKKTKPLFVLDDGGALSVQPPRRWSLSGLVYPWLSPLYLPYLVERWFLMDGPPRDKPRPVVSVDALGPFEVAMLTRAARLAGARGHHLTLVSILRDDTSAGLRRWCAENGVTLLEPGVPFSAELVLGPRDPHWNPQGHRRVADSLRAQWPRDP